MWRGLEGGPNAAPELVRFTIGQAMVGIAVLASLLAVLRLVFSPDRIVMVCLVGLLTARRAEHPGGVGFSHALSLVRPLDASAAGTTSQLLSLLGVPGTVQAVWLRPLARRLRPGGCRAVSQAHRCWYLEELHTPRDLEGTTSGELLQNKRRRDLSALVKRQPHSTGRRTPDGGRRAKGLQVAFQLRD